MDAADALKTVFAMAITVPCFLFAVWFLFARNNTL